MSLRVIDPGWATRLVDRGRPRTRHLGVPVGGAADRAALALANALLGNAAYLLGLEISLKGPILRAEANLAVALVGAPFVCQCGQEPMSGNRVLALRAGQDLYIGGTPLGMRAYLAVPGGFQAAEILGSRSALQPVRAGEHLRCEPASVPIRRLHPDCPLLRFPREWNLRVLPGAQQDWFPAGELERRSFQVTPASNRMGLRLASAPFSVTGREMVSEPVCPGTIQVTREGQAIVLGVDGQTIGGYPKIGQVIRADLDALGQRRPGDTVRFVPVDLDEARRCYRERQRLEREWTTRIRISLDGA